MDGEAEITEENGSVNTVCTQFSDPQLSMNALTGCIIMKQCGSYI